MNHLTTVKKKDIPSYLENKQFWNNSFLVISKHRLIAHYHNPKCDDNDTVLILAYLNNELVGYMGLFTDTIVLNNKTQKIGWLSTWWVHPKTKGTGIGRSILNKMYEVNEGKIGISQFTPSARRVYDKSGYFTTLKENKGLKAVLRSNLYFVIPILIPKSKAITPILKSIDNFINIFVNLKLKAQYSFIEKKLLNTSIEYLITPDNEVCELINATNNNHLSPKDSSFFEWLKSYNWIQESPLLELTNSNKYEFSMSDKSFNIYLVKIVSNHKIIAFIVLQKRQKTLKVLFAYYNKYDSLITEIIKLHAIKLNTQDVICYDSNICNSLNKSNIFLYKKPKIKESIISEAFGQTNFENVYMNFGDGDCSFA